MTKNSMLQSLDSLHYCLSITSSNCLHLIAMAEIIQVPCCKSNLIIPTVLHFHNIHYLVFADPRNLHRHNISFWLIADSSMWTQKTSKVSFCHRMVVFIDEILHIPLPCVLIPCNHKFSRASNTSNISRLPLLNLPLQLPLFAETFTTANKLPKGPLIVAVAPLTIAFSHTKSFPPSVFVIKPISFFFTT